MRCACIRRCATTWNASPRARRLRRPRGGGAQARSLRRRLAPPRLTPHKGTIRDAIAPGLRAIPAAGRGVIVFMVDDAARLVLVKAIGYAGSDWVARARRR
jgi:plasmid stabilization system protein ParE